MKIQVSIARPMVVIAVCAFAFVVLRYASQLVVLVVFYAGPLAGCIWGTYRGGKGFAGRLIGGLVGGVLTCWALGLGALAMTCDHSGPASLGPMLTTRSFLIATLIGAVLGLAVGYHVLLLTMVAVALRYLASIRRSIRLRAEQSAAASAYRPEPQPPRLPRPS
jgi:hypothetical protein